MKKISHRWSLSVRQNCDTGTFLRLRSRQRWIPQPVVIYEEESYEWLAVFQGKAECEQFFDAVVIVNDSASNGFAERRLCSATIMDTLHYMQRGSSAAAYGMLELFPLCSCVTYELVVKCDQEQLGRPNNRLKVSFCNAGNRRKLHLGFTSHEAVHEFAMLLDRKRSTIWPPQFYAPEALAEEKSDNEMYMTCEDVQSGFCVQLVEKPETCPLKLHLNNSYTLKVLTDRLLLCTANNTLTDWQFTHIRKFRSYADTDGNDVFRLEAGRSCSSGDGTFRFRTRFADDINNQIKMMKASASEHSRPPIPPVIRVTPFVNEVARPENASSAHVKQCNSEKRVKPTVPPRRVLADPDLDGETTYMEPDDVPEQKVKPMPKPRPPQLGKEPKSDKTSSKTNLRRQFSEDSFSASETESSPTFDYTNSVSIAPRTADTLLKYGTEKNNAVPKLVLPLTAVAANASVQKLCPSTSTVTVTVTDPDPEQDTYSNPDLVSQQQPKTEQTGARLPVHTPKLNRSFRSKMSATATETASQNPQANQADRSGTSKVNEMATRLQNLIPMPK